jgi:hypothetical protein
MLHIRRLAHAATAAPIVDRSRPTANGDEHGYCLLFGAPRHA